jgi:hypothetical protein
MRNVKVNVQADTSHAIGKVRELTGALAQLDATTKRNVQYLLQALSGAGLNPQQIGAVKNQQTASAQAQSQVQASKGAAVGTSGDTTKKVNEKNSDTVKKVNEAMESIAGKQLDLFIDSFANAIGNVFTKLAQGRFKDAFTGLKTSLQGLFGELMSQLVGDLVGMMKKSLIDGLKGIFAPAKKAGAATPVVNKIAQSFNGLGAATGVGNGFFSRAGDGQNGQGDGTATGAAGAADGTAADSGAGSGAGFMANKNFLPLPQTDEFRKRYPSLAFMEDLRNNPDIKATPIETTESGTKTGTDTGGGAAANAAKQAASFSWGNLGKVIGSMAPALGSSLGGMLGGSSVAGGILGSAGGLIGGTLIGGLLTTGSISGATTGGIFGAQAGLFGLSGAATFGIGLAVAAAFMIGSYFLGRDKQRKADEKTRSQAMVDAFSQLDDILKQIQGDQIDGASGVSQANNIRSQYMEQMSKLKDKKTRNIALKDVSRIDSKISAIKAASSNQAARKALDAKLVPTFADGGYVGTGGGYKVLGGDGASMHPFRGRVPGVYDRRDDFLARLTGNEVVLTPDVWMPIAPYLKQKRVPGFADGGMVQASGFTGDSQASSNQSFIIEELVINLSNQFGSETAARILDVGVKTPDGRQAVIKSVRTHIGESGLGDGLVRDINRVNTRGF